MGRSWEEDETSLSSSRGSGGGGGGGGGGGTPSSLLFSLTGCVCACRSPPKIFWILFFSMFIAIGLLLNVLSCALYHNWWPFFVVVAYALAPFPNIVCARLASARSSSDDDDDDDGGSRYSSEPTFVDTKRTRAAKDLGYFLTGLLIVSGFGIPAVLAHSRKIGLEALGLALGGGVLVYIALVAYIYMVHTRRPRRSTIDDGVDFGDDDAGGATGGFI